MTGGNFINPASVDKLIQDNEQFFSVMDNMYEAFIILREGKSHEAGPGGRQNTDFIITYINKTAFSNFIPDDLKIDSSQVIGKKFSEIFPLSNYADLQQVFIKVMKDGTAQTIESFLYKNNSAKRKTGRRLEINIARLNNSIALNWMEIEHDGKAGNKLKKTADIADKRADELAGLKEEFEKESGRLNKALEELNEAKEFYRIMGEALPYGIWMCDAEGNARYMSQSFLDLLEMTLEEAQEFGWAHRLRPEDVEHMFAAWLECVRTGKDWDSEHRILGPDGKYHTVLTRGKPVRDKEGKILSWVGINLDIDSRKQTEEELKQQKYLLQLVLESLPVGVWILDGQGNTLNTNKAMSDIWGNTRPERYGEHGDFKGYWYKTDKLIEKDEWASTRAIRKGETSLNELIRIEAPDGIKKTILNSAVPILDNEEKIIGAVVVNQDVTEERKYAEALEEIDRAKTVFFSNISHEFRTPLTLILGPVEDMLSSEDNIPESVILHLQMIHRNTLRLQKLVNTLMDFSRIEAGRIQASFEPVDLPAYTEDLTSLFRSAIEKAGIKLNVNMYPFSEPVYVDRNMWEKVVFNLLSNALKYTLKGEIEVSLEQKDRSAVLKVRDTGIGIPKDEIPHLFERFYRVKGAKGRSEEGTGIGLSLLYELVRIHSGSVKAESKPGAGTIFIVEIPVGKEHIPSDKLNTQDTLSSASSGAEPFIEEALRWLPGDESSGNRKLNISPDEHPVIHPDSADEAENERSTVLIVDDNSDMRDYLRHLLSARYDTLMASNGREALDIIKEKEPELVLTDVMMPGMNGLELLQYIRYNSETKTLPVIMLTARAGEESRMEVLEAGADAYLVKPFSARELLTYVKAYLEMSRLRAKAAVNEEIAQKEKALREAEEHYHTLFNAIDEGFCIIEVLLNENQKPVDYRFLEINPAFEKQSGLINALGRRMRELAPEHEEYWFEIYGNVALTGEPARFQNRAEQLHRWYDLYAFSVGPIEEHKVAVLFNDITERKNNEEALRKAKEQYALLFNSINEGFANYQAIYDETGRLMDLLVLEINPAGAALSGVKREEQIGKTWKEVWTGIEDHLFDIYREIDKKGVAFTFEHFSGITKRWYTNNIYRIAKDQFAVTFVDITERKQAEEKLRIREAQLDAFFANSPAILNLVDSDFCYINTDKLTPTYYGLNRETIKGKSVQDLSRDFIEQTGKVMRHIIETGESILNQHFQAPVPGRRGEMAYWSTSMFRVPLGDEKWGVGVISIEITDIKQAEAKLRESEEKFRTLADNISQLAWMADESGQIFWYNKRWYDYTGKTIDAMQGWGWKKVHHPDHMDRVMENWTDALKEGKPWEDIFPLRSKEGEYRWFLSRAVPIHDDNGKISRWFGTNTDITERKKAEEELKESEAKLIAAQKLAHMGSIEIYPETGKIEWSEEMYNIFERDIHLGPPAPEEAASYIHSEDLERFNFTMQEAIVNKGRAEIDFRIVMSDGRIKYLNYIVSPVYDDMGRHIKRTGTIMDITHRKIAELELERTVEEIKRSNRDLEQFAYVASHDLKEPIRMIGSYIQLLEKRYKGRLDENADKYIGFVHEGALRLQALVKDLLNYSHVATKSELFKPVDLNSVLEEALKDLQPVIKESKANVSFSPLPIIKGDHKQLRQLFGNLLDNAVKFRRDDDSPEIKISFEERTNEYLFSVKDNGMGIKPEHYELIFVVFQRLNDRAAYPGTGIGLALSKRIIERHGGRIWVDSDFGKGSTFYFTIPKVREGQF